jgi:hypothetical protein
VEEGAAARPAAAAGRDEWGRCGGRRGRVGLTDRGWRKGSLYRGDGEGFLAHGDKERGAIGDLLRRFHPLYSYFFGIGKGIGKLVKLL